MAAKFIKIRARPGASNPGGEHDYWVSPDSVTLLLDQGRETGLWTGGTVLTVIEPVAQLLARLQAP